MKSSVRFGSSLRRFLLMLPLDQGLMSWFTDRVKLDDRYLRRWLRGDNLPSENSWGYFSQALTPYFQQDAQLQTKFTRLESLLAANRKAGVSRSPVSSRKAPSYMSKQQLRTSLRQVVGFAPAMLDVNIISNVTPKFYLKVLSQLGIQPGDWSTVSSLQDLVEVVKVLSGKDLDAVLGSGFGWEVGSTIAGALSSFTPEYEGKRILRLAYPEMRLERDIDPALLLTKIARYGILATLLPCAGTVDVCLCTYHKAIPERTMVVHRGLQPPEKAINISKEHDSVCFVSAFEIARRFFTINVNELASRGSILALSLGNKKILCPSLRRTVMTWMRSGILRYVFGEIEDYQACFQNARGLAHNDDVISLARGFSKQYPITFMITAAGSGIYAVHDGRIHHQQVRRVTGLINTNGAGDAAAGGFLSVDLATGDIDDALSFAMSQAEQVLDSSGTRSTKT